MKYAGFGMDGEIKEAFLIIEKIRNELKKKLEG